MANELTERRENIFLEEQGIIVTNARLVTPNETFSIANIASVSLSEEVIIFPPVSVMQPLEQWQVILLITAIIIGIALWMMVNFIVGFFAFMIMDIPVAFGRKTSVTQKPQEKIYHIKLRTSSGETKAFSGSDKSFINRIVQAINAAIIDRG